MQPVRKLTSGKLPGILLLLSTMMCALNAYLYLEWHTTKNYALHCDDHRKYLLKTDEYTRRSVSYWSKFANEPADDIVKTYYTNRIDLKNETCVSFFPLYALAGEPVYCYDRKSKHLTYFNQDVE